LAGFGDHILEHLHHARQRRIDLGDAGGSLCRQFRRHDFALPNARGERGPVMLRPFVPAHRQCHAISSLWRDFGLYFGDVRGQHV